MTRAKNYRRRCLPVVVFLAVATGCASNDSVSRQTLEPSDLPTPPPLPTAVASSSESPSSLPTESPSPGPAESESTAGTYAARPEDYLSEEEKATLRRSSVPVLLPTRLPNWTRGVDPIAFLHEPSGSYFVSWTRSYEAADPLAVQLGSGVTLQVTGNYYPPDDTHRLSPGAHGGKRDYYYDDSVCTAIQEGDEGSHEGAGQNGVVQYNSTGRMYYLLHLTPGPACVNGEYTKADAITVMDSLKTVRLDGQ